MGAALRLRGPDEETFYQDDALSFVFRRLSIIDVDGGTQPIWNEDHSIFVAVNGEIYNHQELHAELRQTHTFKTRSDSEIVLHLYEEYGAEALKLLNGMYAIVVWDSKHKTLLLARDRLGIKPLYYTETAQGLLFGSELKALLMHPDCPRSLQWRDLSASVVQEKNPVATYVQDVHHLPAGHFAYYKHCEKFEPIPYWDIAQYFSSVEGDVASIQDKYYQLLSDSVTKQLMSDVPVGLFLSGGIDSATIAGLLAQASTNVHCFTVVERTTYRAGDVEQARAIAQSFGLPFYPIYFDADKIAKDFGLSDFENLICLIESPRFDPEWLFKSELYRAAKAFVPDLKVILLGQGADEFCGGYSKYLGSTVSNWDDYLMQLEHSMHESYVENEQISERFSASVNASYSSSEAQNIYNRKMKLLTYQLQHFNLWHEDRTSSYHSIESRVPFLDHRLVEMAAGVPKKYQQDLFWNKNIVRQAASRCLPDYPKDHPKVPFFVTDDTSSIDEFVVSICLNIYPAFKQKYLAQAHALFHAESMDELFTSLSKTNPVYSHAWQLVEFMAVSIFQQYCLAPDAYLADYFSKKKQALPMVEAEQWAALKQQFEANRASREQAEWTLQSRVNIPDDCEILNPLTETEDTTALVLLHAGKEKQRVMISDEHEWIVMMLDAMGRTLQEPKDVAFWSAKTKVEAKQLVGVLNDLVEGGFLTRV